MAIALRARARELVLVDRDLPRAKAVATDMHYGVPLSPLPDRSYVATWGRPFDFIEVDAQ